MLMPPDHGAGTTWAAADHAWESRGRPTWVTQGMERLERMVSREGNGRCTVRKATRKLVHEVVGGEPYDYYPLGDCIVSAPGMCGGRPTFKYARIEVEVVLDLLAAGQAPGAVSGKLPGARSQGGYSGSPAACGLTPETRGPRHGMIILAENVLGLRRDRSIARCRYVRNSVVSISRMSTGILGWVKCMWGAGIRWCLISGGMCL
jgi:hypothetical protein